MQIGGDGIAFESTKNPPDLNYALFFWDDQDVAKNIDAVII